MYQWRRFPFFDRFRVPEQDENQPLEEFLKKVKITCCSSGYSRIAFGDDEGIVHIFDSNFHEIKTFKAFNKKITHVLHLKTRNILLGIGRDEEDPTPILKIWDLSKNEKYNTPAVCKNIKVVGGNTISDATTIAAMEDLSTIAIGLVNGSVILITGQDISIDKNPKPKKICKSSDNPITGLSFKEHKGSFVLFIADTKSIRRCITTSVDYNILELEAEGSELNCSCITDNGEFVVARNEAIFFYEPEGRTSCFVFNDKIKSPKKFLLSFREYLVVISQAGEEVAFNSINIYNINNKFIAFSIPSCPAISQLFLEFGSIFFLTEKKELYKIEEKDTETKLKTLLSKNLYTVAINLALEERYEKNAILDIQRKYGDYLYQKGEYEAAISRYVETIGLVEPSYVIRKFLDAQRIHNLATYLEKLHEEQQANPDHTTLLLNCYTKLKNVEKLNEFIKGEKKLNFEVETAIRVCTQAGYHEYALFLAQKHEQHQWYLKIILDNLSNYVQALNYISSLHHFEAEKNVKKHGKLLMEHLPDDTTTLIMNLCTSYTPKPLEGSDVVVQKKKASRSDWEEFIYIFVDHEDHYIRFLEFINEKVSDVSSLLYHNLIDLYLRIPKGENEEEILKKKQEREEKALEIIVSKKGKYDEDYVLVLCHNYSFSWGSLFLYEQMQLYTEILQYYIKNNAYSQVLAAAKKYSKFDPNLWVTALIFYANSDEECEEEIKEVLYEIDKADLLSPIRVIQILSVKKTCSLSVVKNFIIEKLNKENTLIDKDKRETHKLKEETKKMKQEIEELRTSARIFNQTKCSACETQLGLPSIHFLCTHSFHSGCIFENRDSDFECPKCAQSIKHPKYLSEESFKEHNEYFDSLKDENNSPFFVISEYFGKGVFNEGSKTNETLMSFPVVTINRNNKY